MKEKKKGPIEFLPIYALIVIISLVLIMFIIPDDFFMRKYKDINIPMPINESEKKEFVDYETQKSNLLNKHFDYEYLLLDSMGTKTYQYNCSGKIEGELESGTCTEPESFSYTESNKDEKFKISTTYLNIEEIFTLIEDKEPEVTKYQTVREYDYETMIDDLKTEIIIHTDLDNITRIDISNAYMTYMLKYSNVE